VDTQFEKSIGEPQSRNGQIAFVEIFSHDAATTTAATVSQ
jgi:hypothetical protein